jgi:ankyrin repeat protein
MVEVEEIIRAIERGDRSVVAGATPEEVNAVDWGGRAPLMHAVLREHDDPSMIELLLERGADPNLVEPGQDWTPLHVAARDQKEATVRVLLEAGARVDPVDVFGNTPLWRSVMSSGSKLAVSRELLRHGADPHRKNKSGVAPIDLAREPLRQAVVALLEGKAP